MVHALEDRLPDRYQVRSTLGKGGMATVYLAHDTKLDRSVAIKVMHPEFAASVGSERFLREIQVTAQLRHPHILPLIDSGGSGEFLYYVMPFIEAGSLRDRLTREGQLNLAEATRIASEVADALTVAHEHHLVHRDIKPENILLDGGHAVVADFGIAKVLTETEGGGATDAMVAIGTPAYMSPEQASGSDRIDHRSDIYSLGCVLYEMLVGEPPFSGPSGEMVLARQISQAPLSPRELRPTISAPLDHVVSKALNKSPADRFASAEDLRAALLGLATGGTAPFWRRSALGLAAAGALILAMVLQSRDDAARPSLDPSRIAFLGFAPLGTDAGLSAFAQNLTGRVIDGLSSIDALSVVSQRGVLPYKNQDIPVDSIARALEVGTLIDATIETSGPNMQIRFQLIDGATGDQIGSGTAEAAISERHLLVNAVADTLIRLLQSELGAAIRARALLLQTQSLQAFEHVLWADERLVEYESALHAGDFPVAEQMLDAADSLFREAERFDSEWVEPIARRAALAELRFTLARAQGDTATRDVLVAGIETAQRAVAKDPNDPRAKRVRGGLRYWLWTRHRPGDPDSAAALIRAAETDLRDALLGSPNRAGILRILSELMAATDRLPQAIQYAEQAYESDPYLENLTQVLLRLFDHNFALKRDEAAARWCREGATRRPDAPMFPHCQLRLMAWANTEAPDLERARNLKEQTLAHYPTAMRESFEPALDLLVAAVAARTGRASEARRIIEQVRRTAPRYAGFVVHEAGVLTILGDTAQALAVIQTFVGDNPDAIPAILHAREIARLRDRPGFDALIADAVRPPSAR